MLWYRLTDYELRSNTTQIQNMVVSNILQAKYNSKTFWTMLPLFKSLSSKYKQGKVTLRSAERELYLEAERLRSKYPKEFDKGSGRYVLKRLGQLFDAGQPYCTLKEHLEEYRSIIEWANVEQVEETTTMVNVEIGTCFSTKADVIACFIDQTPLGTTYKDAWKYINTHFARFEAHKPIGKHSVWKCTEVLQ